MLTPKVSIVIPIYNVEKYLPKCIESVINQSYKNLEIILVDDGSPDNCFDICELYRSADERIRVLHKNNGGLSDARNQGLRIATGEYITFIDSDDYVGTHYIETLLQVAEKYDSDISFCDYELVKDSSGVENKADKDICVDNIECLKRMYHPSDHGWEFLAWGKLYRRILFTDNNIEFPKGKIHEDTFTTYKLIFYSQKVVFCNYIGYFYRTRENSIMTATFNPKRLVMIEATREACDFYKDNRINDIYDLAVNLHFRTFVMLYCEVCDNSCYLNDASDIKDRLVSEYRKDCKRYLKSAKISFAHKLVYYMFAIWPVVSIRKLFK